MDKYLGVDLVEALHHHSGTVIGGDRIGEVYIEHRGLMSWAADTITALQAEAERLGAENEAYKADVEAGRLVRLPFFVGDMYFLVTRYAPVDEYPEYYMTSGPMKAHDDNLLWLAREFGKNVFKTHEDAEAARAALENHFGEVTDMVGDAMGKEQDDEQTDH